MYSFDHVYIYRGWCVQKETNLQEHRYISTESHFFSKSAACEYLEQQHNRRIRLGYDVHPIITNKNVRSDIKNSLENIIMYYDEFDIHNGKVFHHRHEISEAILQPVLYTTKRKEVIYEFSDYIVLDDSDRNHRGYVNISEFFSDKDSAVCRALKESTKYENSQEYSILIRDYRKSMILDERDWSNHLYGITIVKNGHRIRHFDVCASVCRDYNIENY